MVGSKHSYSEQIERSEHARHRGMTLTFHAGAKVMIAPTKVHEVQSLVAQGGHSRREISRMTGVSRAIVGQIADGRRPDYRERARQRADFDAPPGPVKRCHTCGSKVHVPCWACHVRSVMKQSHSEPRGRSPMAQKRKLPANK